MKTIQEMLQELSQCIVTVSGEFRFRTNWNGGKVPQPDLDVFDPNVPFCIENVGETLASIQYNTKNINIKISKNYKTWNDYTSGTEIELNPKERVYIKSDYVEDTGYKPRFVFNGDRAHLRARGNIASLIYGTNDAYVNKYTSTEKYCYYCMFYGCTSLTQAPELPATTLSSYCYSHMFYDCTSLTQAPELPATILSYSCYMSMFSGCTSLTQAPALPATKLYYDNCYDSMFSRCTSLTQAPELPAMTLARYCYQNMFSGCTSLTQAPELPATPLYYDNCYNRMFYGCTSLVQAPELPATTLSSYCYYEMFYGCTSLARAPELPAVIPGEKSYTGMFRGCKKITYIKVLATFENNLAGTFENWLTDVGQNGEICCYSDSEYLENFNPPGSWKFTYIDPPVAEHPDLDVFDPNVPYCVENLKSSCATLKLYFSGYATRFVQYIAISYDNKRWGGWIDRGGGKEYIIKLKKQHDRMYLKAAYDTDYSSGVQLSTINSGDTDTAIRVRGNIYSAVSGDTDMYKTAYMTPKDYCYNRMFYGCTSLTQAPELPVTTLSIRCYYMMFSGCTSLTQAPVLPVTTLTSGCYDSMFSRCTSLTQAPELPATKLTDDCYKNMFNGCTSLTQAPELPATTLSNYCYQNMFMSCASLVQAPELPATTSVYGCYNGMFSHCTKLNYVKCLLTDVMSSYYFTRNWLSNVSSTGDFYTPAATNWTSGSDGIPAGWTRHDIT